MASASINDKPYVFTEDEKRGIKAIRQRMGDIIPAELNTDLNLKRWVNGWKGDIEEIEPRFKAYLENRKAAGFDRDDFEERYKQWRYCEEGKFMEFFNISYFEPNPNHRQVIFNPRDDSVILYEKIDPGTDLNQLVSHVIGMGNITMANFWNSEALLRIILAKEKQTGRPSGLTIVFDTENMSFSNYLHIHSPWNRANKLGMHIFQEWYCNVMNKILLIRPPRLFHVMWGVVKHIMNENTQKKLAIITHNEQIEEIIPKSHIPQAYGGDYTPPISSKNDMKTAMVKARSITETDHYKVGKVWRLLKINELEDFVEAYIKPKSVFTVTKECEKRCKIGWQFYVNGEIRSLYCSKRKVEKQENWYAQDSARQSAKYRMKEFMNAEKLETTYLNFTITVLTCSASNWNTKLDRLQW